MVTRFLATNIFSERFGGTDQNCEIKSAYLTTAGATDNQLIITAVSGKRIRVLEGYIRNGGSTATVVAFKSASGGQVLREYNQLASGAGINADIRIPWNPFGEMETLTGQGLYVLVTAAVTPSISLRYIEFTP
jgi:hypothetical protein